VTENAFAAQDCCFSSRVRAVFLGSAAIGRPLIYQLSHSGVRRRAADKVQAFEALRDDAQFRGSMTVATLVWGFGLLAACALVFMLTIKHYLLIGGPINYAIISMLTAWTFWYVPRAARLAAARWGAAQQGKPDAYASVAGPAQAGALEGCFSSRCHSRALSSLFDHSRGDCPQDFSEKNSSDVETTTKPI
jgi:hypothetical protein